MHTPLIGHNSKLQFTDLTKNTSFDLLTIKHIKIISQMKMKLISEYLYVLKSEDRPKPENESPIFYTFNIIFLKQQNNFML